MNHGLLPFLSLCLAAQTPPAFQEAPLRAHIAFLADDLLEGRGTGQRGGALAVRYLETQLQALGARPAFGSSYRQSVDLIGLRTQHEQSRLTVRDPASDGEPWRLQPDRDVSYVTGLPEARQDLDAELVFVGYGIREGARDDFKNADLRGKVLVALAGSAPEGRTGCCEPRHQAGRWKTKFAQARALGAAGLLIIHRTPEAGYGWGVVTAGWGGERFQLATRPGCALQGWLSEEAGGRLLQRAGMDLESLRTEADAHTFQPRPLGLHLNGTLHSRIRRVQDHNVAGLIPGRDPRLSQEAVVLSAHWDHLGRDEATGVIRPGAVDNATGCAGVLALGRHLAAHPPARSILLLFPAAEEQGLLGADAYVAAPALPLDRTVAVLNLESLNTAGPTRDIGLAGAQGSSLQERAEAAAHHVGLRPTLPTEDPQALFFRADHFAFVRAGIPAFSPGFSLDGGWDYLDAASAERARRFLAEGYHRPADRYDEGWDLRGLLQQLDFILHLARDLGNSPERPVWKHGHRPFLAP
ncbi:MAG: Peptidase family M28 [Acidobacteria bacterium ADurb.Bin340]|nr:MAG: Peptidase family M28 [Acidobacteria bacterium ADurb.Bin340]HQL48243.1 M28 family peptidase [Holophaga sp.]